MSRLIASVRGVVALGVLALGVVACQAGIPPQTFIDGLPVGDRATWGVRDGDRFSEVALADLDSREPNHAPVVAIEAYIPDYRMADGQRLLLTRSGGNDLIIVLRLEDGSVRSVYVGCGAGVEPDRCFVGPPSDLPSRGEP